MKCETVEGYSVIVFVSVQEGDPYGAGLCGGGYDADDARKTAEGIAEGIRKHVGVDYIAARQIDIEAQTSAVCEHCGYAWHGSGVDADYNEGCCAADEDEYIARTAGER